jgi:peptidoglycan/LPS O-acetylase OafA/YrhL
MSAPTISLTSENALRIPQRALTSLIPSYLRRSSATDERPRRVHRTSALDGLRGIAALFVFFFHVLFSYQQFIEYGYGQSSEQSRLIQLPFISLFYRGHAMVAVFFVVGGYVLSLKPLMLIHAHQTSAAHDALVSSVFRRGIRLYMPAIAATFMTMLTIHAGFWEYPRQFITEDRKYISYSDIHPKRQASFRLQFWDWFSATVNLTDLFNYYNRDGFMLPYYNAYDPHLWTVPFEYRSSLIVTLALLAFSRCKPFVRLFLTLMAIIFCGMWDRWELVCFLSGTLLCDFDIAMRPITSSGYDSDSDIECEEKLPDYRSIPFSPASHLRKILDKTRRQTTVLLSRSGFKRWIVLFVGGLFLLSTPNFNIDETPGYQWLFFYLTPHTYTDKKRFLQSVGAILVTWSVANCSALQRPFDTRFAQYLGKISYALYIVHGPLIHMVGYSVTPNMWIWITGMDGWRYWVGLGVGTSVLGSCVAVVADWFWRVVDTRAVTLSRWFEGICFTRD